MERNLSLGQGSRFMIPFRLSDVANQASAVFLIGDTVRTSGLM